MKTVMMKAGYGKKGVYFSLGVKEGHVEVGFKLIAK